MNYNWLKEIMLHGIICDSQGRKMSKSLGNVVDPMDVINGVTLPVIIITAAWRNITINEIDSLIRQQLENQLENSLKSGHLSADEFRRAMEEKRAKFPDGIPQIGADALRFTLCSYNVKSIKQKSIKNTVPSQSSWKKFLLPTEVVLKTEN